jgi:hypothetical protein
MEPYFFFTRVFHSAALGDHGPFDRLVSTAVAAENGHLPTGFLLTLLERKQESSRLDS